MLARKTLDIIKKEGCGAFFNRCLVKAHRLFFRTNGAIWYKKDLNEDICPESDARIKVVFSSGGEIIRWLRDRSSDYPWIYIEKEILTAGRENHLFPFVTLGDEIIGYVKIGFNKVYVHDFEREITLPPRDAMVYDTFVLPEHRGRNIALALVNETAIYLRALGYERLWCHIPEWNTASSTLYRKAGFREVSHIRFVKLMAFRFFNMTPEKMFSGFST